MAAELSSDPATVDLDWADGDWAGEWCRHVPSGDNRNRRLPHRTRVSALSPESWREGNSRQTSRNGQSAQQHYGAAITPRSPPRHLEANAPIPNTLSQKSWMTTRSQHSSSPKY